MIARRLAVTILAPIALALVSGCSPTPQERMASAEEFMEANNYRGAMIELKNLLQEDASAVTGRLLLAEVSLGLGDAESAEKELTKAFDLGAEKAEFLDLYLRVKLALGRFTDVVEQTGSDEWPAEAGEVDRQLFRGQAFLGLHSLDAAQDAFQAVLNEDPSSVEAITGLARITSGRGDYDGAVARLEAALEKAPENVPAWQALGEISLLKGDSGAAEIAFSRAAELARSRPDWPQRARALASLAEVQLTNMELDLARQNISELVGIAPGGFVTRFLVARLAYASGELQESATQLLQLLSDYPHATPAELLLAVVHAARGNFGQAEQSLAKVIAVAPDNLMARKMLARIQLQQGRPQQAVELLAPFLEDDVLDADMFSIVGSAKLKAGEHDSAIDYLRRAVAASPGNTELSLDLAAALIASGNSEDGIKVLENVPDDKGGGYRRAFLLLLAHSGASDQTEAINTINHFLAGHPEDVSALNLVGAYFFSRGEAEQARRYLIQALAIDAGSLASLVNLVRLEMAEKNPLEAEQYLDRLRALDHGNLIGLQGLAQLAISRGEVDVAIALLQEARAGHADDVAIRVLLTRIFLSQEKTQDATLVVAELLEIAPESPEVLAVSGDVMLAAARPREALEHFKRWTTNQPNRAGSYFGEARAYLALSENEAARRALEKAVSLKPDWIPAATALALLEIKEGNKSRALKIAEHLEMSNPESPAPSILRGDILMRNQDFAGAAIAYRKAFVLQPSTPVAIRVHQAAKRAGEPSPQKGLESWLEDNPEDYAVGVTLAEYYQQKGDTAFAIRVYEQVLGSRPNDPATLNNLAWVLHQSGDPRAEQYARRAYALRPDLASISDTLGWILIGHEQLDEGVKLLKAAANGSPGNREIRYHLAVGLAKEGKDGESRAILEKILAEQGSEQWVSDAQRLLNSL